MQDEMKEAGKTILSGCIQAIWHIWIPAWSGQKRFWRSYIYTIDEEGFKASMEEQRVKARNAREVTNLWGRMPLYTMRLRHLDIRICRVRQTDTYFKNQCSTTEVRDCGGNYWGTEGTIFTDETCLCDDGGFCSDTGINLYWDAEFTVSNTIKLLSGKIGHVGGTQRNTKVGDLLHITLEAAEKKEQNTCKNHSANHTLVAESIKDMCLVLSMKRKVPLWHRTDYCLILHISQRWRQKN